MFRNAILFLILTCLSFSLSSCFKWAARAVDKLPTKTALDKSYNYDGKVIIVGAGAAGLAAAKVFEQNNVDYTILEATDRYGGRLKKNTTLADFPIDIGAEWIHSAPITLNILKGKHGNEIDEALIPYHLENAANWDGKELSPNPKWSNNFMYSFMPESKFKNTTWYDFVDEHIAKTVKHRIQFNAPVSAIDYSGNKVIVTTANGETHTADRVLVTVSIGVLKSEMISFTPEMNKAKKAAIEAITFHPGIKVALKFSEKFYPDFVNYTEEDGEKGFYDMAFKKDAQSNVLAFLCTGSGTEKYYDLGSEEEIISSLLYDLDQMFDGKASASYSGAYILENWGQYQYTQGTWTTAAQEKKPHLKTLNLPLQMGVPGAVLSGYYAADQLLSE